MAQIARSIGAAALAGIGPDQRVVFSTAPTRMQRPLPAGAIALAQTELAGQADRLTELAARPREGGNERFNPMDRAIELRSTNVAKVMVVAVTFANGVQLDVVSVGPDGQRVGGGGMRIQPRPAPQPNPDVAVPPSPSEPIALSDEARAAAKVFAGGNPARGGSGPSVAFVGGSGGMNLPPGVSLLFGDSEPVAEGLLSRLLDPAGSDPLTLFVTPALEAYAEAKGKALVANVPDEAFLGLAAVVSEPFEPAQLERALRSRGMVIEEDDAWIVVRPESTTAARSARIDRAALKTLMAAYQSQGRLRVTDLAAYARKTTGGPFRITLDTAIVAAVAPPAALSMAQVYAPSRDALMVIGNLNASQFAQLEAGARMPVASLGGWATGLTANTVFNSFDGPQVATSDERAARQRGRGEGGFPRGPGGFGGLNGEPQNERTVILAQGVPQGATLSMTKDEEPVALAKRGENDRGIVMNAQLLAFERARSELPGMGGRTMAPVSGYVPGRRVTYRLQWTLAPGITMERSVTEDDVPSDGRTVAYNALPADLVEATDRTYERISQGIQRGLERRPEGFGGGQPGRRGGRGGNQPARP